MSEEESKDIIRFLVFSLLTLFTMPFLLLQGNVDSLLLTSCLCSLAIYFLKTSIGKLYTYSAISIICIGLYSLYLTVERKRNSDPTEIVVTGIIKDGQLSREKSNKNSHAYFKISEYPDLTFISKDYEIMQSFKRYRIDSTKNISRKRLQVYNTVNFNTGKNCSFTVSKSHLEWYKKPYVRFWKRLRYPLELEIKNFQLD